jgi:hypothetical protein
VGDVAGEGGKAGEGVEWGDGRGGLASSEGLEVAPASSAPSAPKAARSPWSRESDDPGSLAPAVPGVSPVGSDVLTTAPCHCL